MRSSVLVESGAVLVLMEHVGDLPQVQGIRAQQIKMLALQVSSDDIPIQKPLKAIKKLENRRNGRAVIKGLHGKSSLALCMHVH